MAAILFTCCLAKGLVAAYLSHAGRSRVFHITNSAVGLPMLSTFTQRVQAVHSLCCLKLARLAAPISHQKLLSCSANRPMCPLRLLRGAGADFLTEVFRLLRNIGPDLLPAGRSN